MPSLRQKVTTYFRQLSFIADGPRDGARNTPKCEDDDENNFIIKYLEGRMERAFLQGPEIFSGQNPTDLPVLKIGRYSSGAQSITAACTGPDEGLTGIKRSKLHLSASYADDIDFIDTAQDTDDCYEVRTSITNNRNTSKYGRYGMGGRKLSNSSGITPTSDQNANKTPAIRSRRNSKVSLSNFNQMQNSSSKIISAAVNKSEESNSNATTIVVSMVSTKLNNITALDAANDQNNKNHLNAKTDKKCAVASTSKAGTQKGSSIVSPKNLLTDSTERLLAEAVLNRAVMANEPSTALSIDHLIEDSIAGVNNWQMEADFAYGISVSLYETHMLTKEAMGNPIADCYGMVVHGDAASLALADGVNWGDGARLAARSAVHGCLDYLDRAIFGMSDECLATSTQEVFVSLLRSLWEGHGCILEVGGALSTLTVAVVLPLSNLKEGSNTGKYVVCACNVGDSLGYVYSKKYGVREFTQASHDITSMRDMRDALGALGPADGTNPELSNLTFSMTAIEKGDIVFLTSDGISDNFDPVVGKFAEAWTSDVKLMPSKSKPSTMHGILAPKRENKSASAIYARLHRHDGPASPSTSSPVRPPRTKKTTPLSPQPYSGPAPSRPKYMRSHTVIEPRRMSTTDTNPARHIVSPMLTPKIPKSTAGLPLVTGPQRHALTLHRLEDLLSYGINGTFSPCVSARRLCHLLIDFVRMITLARRKSLEQRELFYKLATGMDGRKHEVELNRGQHRVARKRIIDSSAYMALPGKLDHATVLAYTVGGSENAPRSDDSKKSTRILPTHESKQQQATVGVVTTVPTVAGSIGKSTTSAGPPPLQPKEFKETNF